MNVEYLDDDSEEINFFWIDLVVDANWSWNWHHCYYMQKRERLKLPLLQNDVVLLDY